MQSTTSNDIYPKRLVERLNSYWNLLRQDAEVPLASRFNGGAIADVYDNCLKIEITGAPGAENKLYNCDYVGRKLAPAFSADLQNRYFMSRDSNNPSRELVTALNYTIEKKCFFKSEGQFVNIKGNIVKYRDCIMPFAGTTGDIKMLIVGISWRAYS